MLSNFTISAFADEISPDLKKQVETLRANGISHMELRGIDGQNVSEFTADQAQEYKKYLDASGIKVSSLGSPIGKIKIDDDFAPQLELFKHVLEIAQIFEVPYIRMFSFFIDKDKNADDYRDEVINRWRQYMEAAEAYPQITLLHENEKEIFGDTPERCLTLLQAINSPQLRMAFDPANFVQCDVETYPHVYDLLKDYVSYVHIKDAKFEDHEVYPAGFGDGHVAEILTGLANRGYEGYLSIEPHLGDFKGFSQLELGNKHLQTNPKDGAEIFDVAAAALKKILEPKYEWK